MGRIKWFAAWNISGILQQKQKGFQFLSWFLPVGCWKHIRSDSGPVQQGKHWDSRGLCELELCLLFYLLLSFCSDKDQFFPFLPSASVPNAVVEVESRKCWWDAVRRVNAHLRFHTMACDFCVEYVKKGGVISASRTLQNSAWHCERSCLWSQQLSTLLLPLSFPFLFSFALLNINILQTPFALLG